MSDKPNVRRTIADIIMEKLTEKKTEIQTQLSDIEQDQPEVQIDERVVNMYKQIRDVLSKYRSGKLPKAFKILPSLTHWEHVSEFH
jgi:essential nuclear protein 1